MFKYSEAAFATKAPRLSDGIRDRTNEVHARNENTSEKATTKKWCGAVTCWQ